MEHPLNNDTISKAQWEFAKSILEELQFSDQISTRAPLIPLAAQNIQGLEGWAFRIAWAALMSTNTAQKESHMQTPRLQVSELLNTHSSLTQVKEKKNLQPSLFSGSKEDSATTVPARGGFTG